MTKIVVTGGAGLMGHHFVEHLLKNTDWQIVVLDRLNYASNGLDRLRDIECFSASGVDIFTIDLCKPLSEGVKQEIGEVDYIVHMAAETHVDNSIIDPYPFVMSNVVGTLNILEFAKEQKNLKQFVYFSTDEVFGPAPEGTNYKEWARYNSGNPYAATKAGGEELCLAYANTHNVPVLITHTMNLFGERQHPEKFIPLVINKVLAGETVYIHSNSDKTKAGSRFYIHCRNVSAALVFLIEKQQWTRHKMNIVGEKEVDNLELAQLIAKIVGKPLKYEMVDFHSARPGHDLRYALDGFYLRNIGWNHPKTFEKSLEKTVRWMLDNPKWLDW